MSTPSPLSAKREQFCQRFVVHGNGAKAAEEARYSARSAKQMACDLLREPTIRARIAELQADVADRNETDADWVRANAKEIVERCMQRAPVMERRGRQLVQKQDAGGNDLWQFDAQGALGALTLIAKLGGLFVDTSAKPPIVAVSVHVTREIVDPRVSDN